MDLPMLECPFFQKETIDTRSTHSAVSPMPENCPTQNAVWCTHIHSPIKKEHALTDEKADLICGGDFNQCPLPLIDFLDAIVEPGK